jgi:hypothetical protein
MKNYKMRFCDIQMVKTFLVMLGLVVSLSLQSQQSKAKQHSITIKGTIENYDRINSQFAKESFLQLLVLPPDGSYSSQTDSTGRMIFTSEYAKTPVSKNGEFIFQLEDLKSETYYIVAQLLQHRSYNASAPFLIQNSKDVKIVIKENMPLPVVLDIGKCIIKEK